MYDAVYEKTGELGIGNDVAKISSAFTREFLKCQKEGLNRNTINIYNEGYSAVIVFNDNGEILLIDIYGGNLTNGEISNTVKNDETSRRKSDNLIGRIRREIQNNGITDTNNRTGENNRYGTSPRNIRENVNGKFQIAQDLGYHAGDLGKSHVDDIEHQDYSSNSKRDCMRTKLSKTTLSSAKSIDIKTKHLYNQFVETPLLWKI